MVVALIGLIGVVLGIVLQRVLDSRQAAKPTRAELANAYSGMLVYVRWMEQHADAMHPPERCVQLPVDPIELDAVRRSDIEANVVAQSSAEVRTLFEKARSAFGAMQAQSAHREDVIFRLSHERPDELPTGYMVDVLDDTRDQLRSLCGRLASAVEAELHPR